MKTWQETVLNQEKLAEAMRLATGSPIWAIDKITEADLVKIACQAEITWKARDPEIVEAHKSGIKEVVEWIDSRGILGNTRTFHGQEWQAFCNEKG